MKDIKIAKREVSKDSFYNPITVETVDDCCDPVILRFGNDFMQYSRTLCAQGAYDLGIALIEAARNGDVFDEIEMNDEQDN